MTIEPLLFQPSDVIQPDDDALLDGWLASLTPNQLERILDVLALERVSRRAAAS